MSSGPDPTAPISLGRVAFGVLVGAVAVAGGVWLGSRGTTWLGAAVALMGMATMAEPLAARTDLRAFRVARWGFFGAAVLAVVGGLVAVGAWVPLAIFVGLPALLFGTIGRPLVGVLPAFLAARRRGLGLSLRDLLGVPVRWGKAVRAVEATHQMRQAGANVTYVEVGMAGAAGADPGRLAEAVEARLRSGRSADVTALSAVSLAGHDPVPFATADDVVAALVALG